MCAWNCTVMFSGQNGRQGCPFLILRSCCSPKAYARPYTMASWRQGKGVGWPGKACTHLPKIGGSVCVRRGWRQLKIGPHPSLGLCSSVLLASGLAPLLYIGRAAAHRFGHQDSLFILAAGRLPNWFGSPLHALNWHGHWDCGTAQPLIYCERYFHRAWAICRFFVWHICKRCTISVSLYIYILKCGKYKLDQLRWI